MVAITPRHQIAASAIHTMLKILLLSLASAAVAFVVFGTQGTSTSSIANKIADGVLPVLCHKVC